MNIVLKTSLWPLIMLTGLIASINPVWAGPGVWTSSGPNGGSVNGLVASPFTSNEFYAVSPGGVFKSVDGGENWVDSSAGINRQVFDIVHSQTAVNRLMVSGSLRIFFSNDGAVTWQDRTPAIGLPAGTFYSLMEASPNQPGVYYLMRTDGSILRTGDSGLNWTVSTAIPITTETSILAFAVDSVSADRVLVAIGDFLIEDFSLWVGDLSSPAPPDVWTEVSCLPGCLWEFDPIRTLEFGTGNRVWAINSNGAFRSDDSGLTWTVPDPFGNSFGQNLAINPANNSEVYVGGRRGLAYTADDGLTWTEVSGGFVGNNLLQVTQSTEVVYNPFNTAFQLAGTQSNGVYRRNSTVLDSFVPGVNGFNAQNIRAITPALGNRVHAAVSDAFVATFASFRSIDNGLSWSTANSGLEADHFRALIVDPNDSNILYAGGVFRPKNDGLGGFSNGNGGIYKSTDAGLTWTTIDNGIPLTGPPFVASLFGTVRDIAVDEFSAPPGGDSQILYAAGTGRISDNGMGGFTKTAARVYKSTDAGANWAASDTGLGLGELTSGGFPMFANGVQIVMDTTDITGNTLYLATFLNRSGIDVPLVIENGVFKTTNAGANWFNVTNGLPRIAGNPLAASIDVLSLAFDPTDASGQTLYASTNDLGNGVLGSVYKTTDGGANWTFSGTGLENRDVRDLVVDPDTGDVYAAIADPGGNGDGGVFVSQDGGSTWASISTGFPAAAVALKLELDNTGTNLLIQAGTTRGVQTFEVVPDGDIDGAPTPIEGGAPNSGDGNLDGMPDGVQSNVASPQINDPLRGTSSYITASLVGISGNCLALQDSFGLDLLSGIPAEFALEAPFNGLHLRIPDCEQAEIILTYHGADFSDPSFVVRGYGLAFPDEDQAAWQTLPATLSGNEWTITLTDGAPGDATPDDGIIVFQGAAKRLVESFFKDSLEAE